MDLLTSGMPVAAVSQAPFDGGKVIGIDRAAALASPGVIRIVELGDTVAVVARNYWSCCARPHARGVKWSVPADGVDTATLAAKLQAARKALPGEAARTAPPAARSAPRTVRALYEAPLLAHAQMEPQTSSRR